MIEAPPTPPVVILSGGSEVVSVALADEFRAAHQPVNLISLGESSILDGALPARRRFALNWPTEHPEEAAEQLIAALTAIRSRDGPGLQIFPTEDSGLRLLLETRQGTEDLVRFGRCRALPVSGGLDKAELFGFLAQADCSDVISPTLILDAPADTVQAWSRFDGDFVIKPALKPWSMRIKGMSAKVLMSSVFAGPEALQQQLESYWPYSERWVAQPRLYVPENGERVVYLVRDEQGRKLCMMASEPRKQPRHGGTSCVVVTEPMEQELALKSARVTDALDLVGMCELAFLKDKTDQWRLLEVNPRPWLQIGLARAAGVSLARQASLALAGHPVDTSLVAHSGIRWVSIERLLISAMSGDYGSRWSELIHAMRTFRQADTFAIYSAESPGVRWRWFSFLLHQARIAEWNCS